MTASGGVKKLLLRSQRKGSTVSKLKWQINDLTKQRKPEKCGNGVNWRLTVYDLNQVGIVSTVEEVSFLRLQLHLGPHMIHRVFVKRLEVIQPTKRLNRIFFY